MTRTLGRQHPTIRRLRRLRRDGTLRREQSVLLAEGMHLAREALASEADIELALVSPRLDDSAEGRELRRDLESGGVDCLGTSAEVLDSLQDARSAQPVLTVVRRPSTDPDRALASAPHPVLAVATIGIQDPGNLGAVVRTAEAAGAAACFVDEAGVDPFHPRAVRATMGSIFRLPLLIEPVRDTLRRLRGHGLCLLGADPRRGDPYDRAELGRPLALVLGGEGAGLPGDLEEMLDGFVHVPMRPGVESLSVGAAAAVLLFEAARQRKVAQLSSER